MSEFTQTTTHEADGAARLLERFKGKSYFEGLLRLVLRRVQTIENVIWDLYNGVWLDNAEGVQLDNLGDVVGEARKGRGDTQYRLYIRARIKINRSNGKASDTLQLARLLLEPTATVLFTSEYPAAYRVDVANTAIAASDLATLLDQVRPAGVGLTAVVTADDATVFTFAVTDIAGTIDAAKGFGNDAGSTGGKLAAAA